MAKIQNKTKITQVLASVHSKHKAHTLLMGMKNGTPQRRTACQFF